MIIDGPGESGLPETPWNKSIVNDNLPAHSHVIRSECCCIARLLIAKGLHSAHCMVSVVRIANELSSRCGRFRVELTHYLIALTFAAWAFNLSGKRVMLKNMSGCFSKTSSLSI